MTEVPARTNEFVAFLRGLAIDAVDRYSEKLTASENAGPLVRLAEQWRALTPEEKQRFLDQVIAAATIVAAAAPALLVTTPTKKARKKAEKKEKKRRKKDES